MGNAMAVGNDEPLVARLWNLPPLVVVAALAVPFATFVWSIVRDGREGSVTWLDQKQDGAIELLAKRADSMTLALNTRSLSRLLASVKTSSGSRRSYRSKTIRRSLRPGNMVYINVPRGVLAKGHCRGGTSAPNGSRTCAGQ